MTSPRTSTREIVIDPLTRLEGHGRVHMFLDEAGAVDRAYLQIPELRGFEKFAQGRRSEDMPQITSRICGVCPMAHHMASAKTLDALYAVEPPPAARKIRELIYSALMVEDHALHFLFLGGPDFIVGPDAAAAKRNILGVVDLVGLDIGKEVIGVRKQLRDFVAAVTGKAIHPVFGLPGGISRGLTRELQSAAAAAAERAVAFALFALDAFRTTVLGNPAYVDLVTAEAYTHRTYYMGLVDAANRPNFYDGEVRVVDLQGAEFLRFPAAAYLDQVAEHVEPWTYMKFTFLKAVGWRGFTDGADSGVFSLAPLARINAADGMATPRAQEAYEELVATLGGKPVHHTLANHWARLVEMLYAAERMAELAADPEILGPDVRTIPTGIPTEGIGVVEAPRGTLFHHYRTDERKLITSANLIVATQNNAARIALSVDKAARALIRADSVDEGALNQVEMAYRAYDPCFGCATHSLPGTMPLVVEVRDAGGAVVREIRRG
ncbi:MAG TPA: Ni/Fe hydrogenase subunit alpha [Mycobacteriales bacterium]|nr:Ni/Fe hydrogenase subunit alpha [Mycobacteriales bacterium]